MARESSAPAASAVEQVPGYVLLWYAFDAFYELHAAPTPKPTESGAVPAAPEGT